MATKAGDDPESLMSLCTVFCLKNLRRTMCYMAERNKLCLRPDVFLPSEICDKLVNVYVATLYYYCYYSVLELGCTSGSEGVRSEMDVDNNVKQTSYSGCLRHLLQGSDLNGMCSFIALLF